LGNGIKKKPQQTLSGFGGLEARGRIKKTTRYVKERDSKTGGCVVLCLVWEAGKPRPPLGGLWGAPKAIPIEGGGGKCVRLCRGRPTTKKKPARVQSQGRQEKTRPTFRQYSWGCFPRRTGARPARENLYRRARGKRAFACPEGQETARGKGVGLLVSYFFQR